MIRDLQVSRLTLVDSVVLVLVLVATVLLVVVTTTANQLSHSGFDGLEHLLKEFTNLLLQLQITNLISEVQL